MKVLYATDGLRPAVEARRLIEKVMDRTKVEITVLSVATFEIFTPERADLMTETMEYRRARAGRIAEDAAAELREAGFRAEPRVEQGGPGRTILELLESGAFDLAVMGAGSHSWLHNVLLGSTSTLVLHAAPRPVLIVHETTESERCRVLVATDGSACARSAWEGFAAFSDAESCDVTVASVVEEKPALAAVSLPVPVYPSYDRAAEERVRRDATTRAERYTGEATRSLRALGFPAESLVMYGHPAELLLKESEGGSYDLVVVGSRGLGAVKRTVLGSAGDPIARHSHAALVAR